jgi:hypothetical protein
VKTGRNILISAILALSAGGVIAASAAAPAVVAAAPAAATHVLATGTGANPNSFYHT